MAKRKEEWVELPEAVNIMSEKHGRKIAPGFITRLAMDGKITTKKKDGRTNYYLRRDIERYTIRQKKATASPPESVEPEPETTDEWFDAQRLKFAQQEATS